MTTTNLASGPRSDTGMLRFGLLLMGGFTMMWMSNALGSGHALTQWLGSIGLAAGAALYVAWYVAGRGRQDQDAAPTLAPADAPGAARRPRHGRFGFAVAVEVVGIFAVVRLLAGTRPELVVPAIALVVALHFLLVHRAFPHPAHVVTTVVGSLVAAAGAVLALGGTDPALVRGLVGLGMGGITLFYGFTFVRGLGLLDSRH